MQCYISTYGLYNAGFLSGRWFDATELDDPDTILAEIQALAAKDGANPDDIGDELMIQDSDGFPIEVSETSSLAELAEIAQDCESDGYLAERVELAHEAHGLRGMSWHDIKELCEEMSIYEGHSLEDAAGELVDAMGILREIPETLRNYFDYEKYARDLCYDGYTHVRRNGTSYLIHIP
jgi:antirestriction protein